jgi:hypothetical protein
VLNALASHPFDRMLQISGTAALFYAIRNANMDSVVKRRVVEVMINGWVLKSSTFTYPHLALEVFNDEPVSGTAVFPFVKSISLKMWSSSTQK